MILRSRATKTMASSADRHKHLDYIQAVIARLGTNSFLLKGWALTLSTAIVGFAVTRADARLALVATITAVSFWLLDTYYLKQERAFREIFREAVSGRIPNFEMNPRPYAKKIRWRSVMFTMSLGLYYGLIATVSLLAALLLALPAGSSEPSCTASPHATSTTVPQPSEPACSAQSIK